MQEFRDDFRGGLNTQTSPDLLNPNELILATNIRLDGKFGAIRNRPGCRKLHQTALGSPSVVTGVYQWIEPGAGALQLVAVANTDVFYKTSDYGAFTTVAGTQSSTNVQSFTESRITAGAAKRLVIVDGTDDVMFTGSALIALNNTTATLARQYHSRLWTNQSNNKTQIKWSELGVGNSWATGDETKGGTALVGLTRGGDITALEVIGGSLVVCTDESCIRVTGYSSLDIQVEQDQEGISSEVGAVGPLAIYRVENIGFMITKQGPYIVTESAVTPIGSKIRDKFDGLDLDNLDKSVVGYNPGKQEVWFAVPGASDGGINKTVYVFSLRLQAWSGPWNYNFGITCFGEWEDSTGRKTIVAGCSDGFVRDMDAAEFLDNVLYDGSGGVSYICTAELAPFFFDSGPGEIKTLRRFHPQIRAIGSCELKHAFDDGSLSSEVVTADAAGVVKSYRVDAYNQGSRLRVQFVMSVNVDYLIHGLTVDAFRMFRD
jgi:hypothetical protein